MLGCTSICPETTYQKLESQRTHKTMDLYGMFEQKFMWVWLQLNTNF